MAGVPCLLVGLFSLSHGPGVEVELHWRERLEEGIHDYAIDRIGGKELADRSPVLSAQSVAHVVGAALVLHDHFAAALAAVDDTVQERLARPGDAAGLVAIVLGVVVL